MSLFSVIQGSANALRVNQLGLQVVGNNIANVNTPGYIRQELVQNAAFGYRSGELIIGQGVEAAGIHQKYDAFLLERMRQTQSQLSYQEALAGSNNNIESYLNELTSNDLSTKFSELSNAFQEVANQPGNESIRELAVLRGQELAGHIRSVADNVSRTSTNSKLELVSSVDQINRLTQTIANLNVRIVEVENGSKSDAVGLRDERIKALDELATYVDLNTVEQVDKSVTVFVGGDFIVSKGISRDVKVSGEVYGESNPLELRFADNDSKLTVSGGKVRALYETANMMTQEGFLGRLDGLAKNVIDVVNRIHTQGQGAKGFDSVLSVASINRPDLPLEVSNPEFNIDNGSFQIHIMDVTTRQTRTIDVPIRQQGLNTDTTAEQLATYLDSVDGLRASVSNDGRFEIRSESEALTFSFANDSSGVLAALGINTFFVGNSASSIGVNEVVARDSSYLAASADGTANGSGNAVKLAEAFIEPSSQLGGKTLNDIYDNLISETTRDINSQKGVADGLRNFYQTLEAKHLGISGVNLDEEAVRMMMYQRAFQAQSRVIAVANEMLNTLVNLV